MIGLFPLKQSTASQEVLLGPFLDDTDGKTAETGLTIANTDIKIWKSGGTTEASKNSGGGTHIASGRYYAVLDATDTDTLGPLEINVHVSGALPVKLRCIVLTANAYDSLVSGSDKLQVDTTELSGAAQTARDIGASVLLSSGTGTGQISLSSGNVTVAGYASGQTPLQPTVAGRTLDVTATGEAGIDWANIGGAATSVNLSGTTISTTQAVASVSGAVGSVTGNVGGTINGFTTSAKAEIQTEAEDALIAHNLDHLVKIAVDTDFATTVHLNSVIGHLADNGTTPTYDRTTDSLEAMEAAVASRAPSSTALSTAQWTNTRAGYLDSLNGHVAQTGDSYARIGANGAGLSAVPWNASWDAEVQSEAEDALIANNLDHLVKIAVDTDFATTVHLNSVIGHLADNGTSATFDRTTDSLEAIRDKETDIETDTADIQARLPATLVSGRMDSSVGAMAANVITAAATAADYVTEVQSGLSTLTAAGVRSAVGLASANLDTQLDAIPTAGENADAVWDEALSGHLSAGSAGNALNAAGSAGDPWSTSLPGAYGAGSAGKIIGDNLNATVGSRATQASVDAVDNFIDTEIADIQSRLPASLVGGRMDASVGVIANDAITAAATAADFVTEVQSGLSTLNAAGIRSAVGLASANLDTQLDALPTAGENADAVWDENLSGHLVAGTAGAALNAAAASSDPWPTVLPGAYGAGTAGNILGNYLNAAVGSRATPADVLAQVNAALDAAGTELATVPTTTGSMRQKLSFLFQYFRNKKTQTSSTETLFKEDDSISLGTATLSDDGTTATKGEMN